MTNETVSNNRVPAGVPTGGQFAASAKDEAALTLTAPVTPQDPATQARYKVVEESQSLLERDVCDPLDEGFGDEDAPDTTALRDYLGDGWYDFDNADGTIAALRAYADHLEAAETHVWNTANDAPGGGHDEMNGRRAAAREDYWDARAQDGIKSLKETAARMRALADQHEDADFTGSGWGTHRPTAPVTEFAQIRVDDVLAEQDEQFGSRNLILVTSVDTRRGVLHGFYTDPANPGEKRIASDMDLAVWDFNLEKGEYSFTDIRGPE